MVTGHPLVVPSPITRAILSALVSPGFMHMCSSPHFLPPKVRSREPFSRCWYLQVSRRPRAFFLGFAADGGGGGVACSCFHTFYTYFCRPLARCGPSPDPAFWLIMGIRRPAVTEIVTFAMRLQATRSAKARHSQAELPIHAAETLLNLFGRFLVGGMQASFLLIVREK